MYALMKVIAKFSLEELKYIPELLPVPRGWRVPCKGSASVSKVVHKVKLEAKGIACHLFDARAEHLIKLDFSSLRQCQLHHPLC